MLALGRNGIGDSCDTVRAKKDSRAHHLIRKCKRALHRSQIQQINHNDEILVKSLLTSRDMTPLGYFIFGSITMSNLIPSLETFAKAGNLILAPPSVPRASVLCSAVRGVYFCKRSFAWIVRSWSVLSVVCLRGLLRPLRDWARMVNVYPGFRICLYEYHSRAGMGLHYTMAIFIS
jgi:hypothetical protein